MSYWRCTIQRTHHQLYNASLIQLKVTQEASLHLANPVETYGSLLVPIILNMFPADVRRNLTRQHGSDEWTIDELQGALLTEIRILETGSHHLFKAQSNSSQFTAPFHTNSVRKPSHTASDLQTQKKPTCVYYKGPHANDTCEAIKDHQKRLDIIK